VRSAVQKNNSQGQEALMENSGDGGQGGTYFREGRPGNSS